MTGTQGLRERKKAETRLAVYRAAMRLTVDKGYENVTVEAIAEESNISRRTFFNYFSDKADALMYGEEERHRRLIAAFRARPAEESGWTALSSATLELFGSIAEPDREWIARTLLARRHPTLLARQLANLLELEQQLAALIAERDDDSGVRPRVIAAALLSSMRAATNLWLDDDQARSLPVVMSEALDALASRF
ncbi:TetR/AcrR family transcriptional regulator [Actinocorallia sp. A-T 12471]|uniref:TetR/AcrR family transcriptional regulator n=1 Tax=Actinocorallia sp. A-T 12471 TaxID=3089813 RepID=UPI0029CD5BC6|nr:TetR family transcriptional regulator [Actinocorallia sp. A-T 12471]MDX6741267.1 TetR family transcriptional regulator [Actinocorallia sp. A-T 12471]